MKVKRTLWILLALLLILGAGARAEGEPAAVVGEGSCGESLTWTLREDGVLTIAGSGDMKNYSYSSDVPWYRYRTQITGILLPEELTGIGANAFSGCEVTEVTVPASVTKLGKAAFYNCSKLESAVILNPAAELGSFAFYGCSALKSFAVPGAAAQIGEYAFYNCSALERIAIPASVTEIGNGAFFGCSALTDVDYGGSLAQWAGITVGNSNDALTENTVKHCSDADAQRFGSCGEALTWTYDGAGTLTVQGSGAMSDFSSGSNVPWFKVRAEITEVRLPEGLTGIGSFAFYGCAMTQAAVPASVTRLGNSAFSSCASLARIAIPASLTEIGNGSFGGCSALTDVDYGGSMAQWAGISIGNSNAPLAESAVKHCSDGDLKRSGSCGETLTWAYDDAGTLIVLGSGAMSDFLNKQAVPWYKFVAEITEVRLPEGLTGIGDYAFSGCAAEEIAVPASVTRLGSHAFSSCTALKRISGLASITEIGSNAFTSCASLERIAIPLSVTEIGENAFYDCAALTDVDYGGSMAQWMGIHIGYTNGPLTERAVKHFSDGDALLIGACGEGLTYWLGADGTLTVSGSGAMSSRPWSACRTQIRRVVLKDGITSVFSSAFDNCEQLERVTVPVSVTEIGSSAFTRTALTDVDYGGSMAQWTGIRIDSYGNKTLIDDAVKHCSDGDARWFGTCGEGLLWKYDDKGTLVLTGSGAVTAYSGSAAPPWSGFAKEITALRLPEGLTGIGDYAFYGCALTAAELPAGLTEIGQYAFGSCAALERVAVPASLTKIGANAFYGCAALTELSFGGEISDWARIDVGRYNSELDTAVKLCGPEQTAWLGAGLCGAEGADLIWMMDGEYDLTISGSGEMKDYQYSSNVPWKNAKTVTLTEGVTGICQQAFRDFTQLTKATLPESLREIGRYAFANTGLTEITIPAALTSIPNYAFQNCAALAKVTLTESLEEVLPWAFNGCSALTDVYFSGTWEQWQKVAVGSSNTPLSTAVKHCTDREMIAVGTCGEDLSWELDGEGTLTVSGEGGMSSSTGWYDCRSAIRKVLLPEGLASVSANAFENCTELTEVRIPSGVTSIVSNSFVGCTSLTRIDVEEGNTVYWSRDGVLYGPYSSYDKSAALCCYPAGRPGRSFTVPEGVPVINSYAFSDCVFLEELVLPAGVARMGYNAVQNCPALSSATISHTVTNIGGSALCNCPALTVRGYDGSEIEAYAQENGLAWESLGPIVYTEVYISYETHEDPSAALRQAVGQKYTHVVLGDGIYNTGMLIPNSELIVEAEHPGKVEILSSDGSLPVISMSGVARENIELRGLILGHSVESGYQMSCMGPGRPGDPGGDVIYAAGVQGLVVENCDLWGCGIVGIRMYDCAGVEVRGCILRDCVESAVVSSGSEAAFESCVISGNAYSNQSFDCLRLSGDLSRLRFSDCLFINNRNPALTSAVVPEGFFDSCAFHDNVWQGLTPGTYGVCLGGVTWEGVKTGTGYRLRFGSAITCQDGAVLPGVSGEVPSYSSYSKPWKRLSGVQESEVTSPGARLRLPAGTEASTLLVGSAGLIEGRSYSVFYALYDENGRMFDLRSKQFTVSGELSSELLLEGQPAGTVCRVFLLDGFVPQTDTIQVQFVD